MPFRPSFGRFPTTNKTSFPQIFGSQDNTPIVMSDGSSEPSTKKEKVEPSETDGFSFGVVYANDLARKEFSRFIPKFPIGSIIVREKRAKADSESPQIVIAMVKREKGFSKKTNDWEFFTFNGADLKLQKRETKSDCAKCHSQAKETDFVFKTYLK